MNCISGERVIFSIQFYYIKEILKYPKNKYKIFAFLLKQDTYIWEEIKQIIREKKQLKLQLLISCYQNVPAKIHIH